MAETWIERDGGRLKSFRQSYAAPCSGCPSLSVNYEYNNDDEQLGQRMIQFTDPLSYIYGILYMNFKRRNP